MPSTKRTLRAVGALGAMLLGGCAGASMTTPASKAASDRCDRACLMETLDAYLAAVVAHDPSTMAFAPGYRETQNAVDRIPTQGLWASATGLGTGVRYADPVAGEAGWFGTVLEDAGPAITALRLKVEGGAVAEAEWIVAREGMAFYNPPAFIASLPRESLPAGVASTDRATAIAAANSYFEGIDESDGALVMAHPECSRIENGAQTVGRTPSQPARTADTPAGDGVSSALSAGITSCSQGFANLRNVTEDVIDRRFFYDAEAGAVWGHGVFTRVPGYVTSQGGTLPQLNFVEIFEIDDGQIRGITAAMNYLPTEIKTSGWPGPDE